MITNEWNEPIPAKVYSRIVKSEINGEKEKIYQILIFFDNKNTYNPVLIIPKYSVIGIVEGGGEVSFGILMASCFKSQKNRMSILP